MTAALAAFVPPVVFTAVVFGVLGIVRLIESKERTQ